jgi:hypothetical protein
VVSILLYVLADGVDFGVDNAVGATGGETTAGDVDGRSAVNFRSSRPSGPAWQKPSPISLQKFLLRPASS